ncbi:SelB C-terminal domain-containing protein [Candidatus Binatus sp.]|uniref:SelB domain-containing protein n=1 Tax=Candidatus Binatus sp. TaxID=2811406 RepID=UPI003C6F2387
MVNPVLQREDDLSLNEAIAERKLGVSRKFAIALLDHFDHTGVTTRVGDTRRLRS